MSRGKIDPRLAEMLADDALFGLTEEERRELEAQGGGEDPTFELAAAAADLSTLQVEAMPPHVLEKIGRSLPPAVAATQQARGPVLGRATTSAWLAAAACAVVAAGGWWAYATKSVPPRIVEIAVPASVSALPAVPLPLDLPTQRAELLRHATDAVTLAWQPTKEPAGRQVEGDIVWSEAEQRGFMRFRGLPANDPTKSQYQLWLFDRAQGYPVDGGVFDVSAADEVIVPITAKLRVIEPTLFAVTIERPGGVVVSKKEHIVATASPKAG